ncbi:non-ribosomal peptide synthetase [Hyunsoonleella ulvae]|uniref:non-ribosomal peptide synthetase n=1 Tax=Hyunsoonleella ulvae TaxID=2799948 RepID=UPI00193928F5|nr:amino acid adenylation domain-containing protein [Hyunsoonleella ulvae]
MENKKKGSLLQQWKDKTKSGISKNSIEKAPKDVIIPLSSGQKRLWFLQQLYPENPFYNYSETYTFKGSLDIECLSKSLKKVYETHDILRTIYIQNDKAIIQKVDYESTMDINIFDFSDLDKDKAISAAKIEQKRDATMHFSLDKSPLVRATIIKISDTYHILQITLHHITTDKWSMKIFREDLAAYYKEFIDGKIPDDRRTHLQYTDYCYWIENQEIDKKALDYWKEKLLGEIPELTLPYDFQRPNVPSYKGAASFTQNYPKALSDKIFKISQTSKTTPYNVMLAVYYIFLYKLSGQNDILIGTPITNRDKKSLENLIGFFNDTIVLRGKINPNLSFTEFIGYIKNNTLEAFENKSIAFDTLVKEIGVKRSLASNPFFQVMFLYHSKPENPFFSRELELSHTWFDSEVSKFELTIYVGEEDGILSSTFEYAHDLFEEKTIKRFQDYFKTLIFNVTENPNIVINDLDILTVSHTRLASKEKKDSNTSSQNTGIHNIIENISTRHPDKIAVSYNNTSLTYLELNNRANMLAHKIRNTISKRKTVIGLCVERHPDMIVGILGILKAGCCYLPLDPEYPKDRINFMLEDSGAELIVTQSQLENLFLGKTYNSVKIDTIESITNTPLELPEIHPDDLAYIIYTSGSTGKPKGVPISHKNIIGSTMGRLKFYEETPKAFMLMSSFSFDSSKAGIFWTLCTGGNLIITEKRIEQDIEKIGNLINEKKVTHTLMLPSLYSLVLDYIDIEKLKSLNTVIVAGEACSTTMCKIHFSVLPKVNLYNEYGPTEASVWCIAHKISIDDLKLKSIPIGKPVADAQIYILNEQLKQVPLGVSGEIHIGGAGLSKGYINRADLTTSVFIDSPFNANEKLYKTGDLGRFKKDGNIEFLGRKDQQIKIRGFRVELSEIENTIKKYSQSLSDAIVVVDKNNNTTLENLSDEELADILEPLEDEDLNSLLHAIQSLSLEEKKMLLSQT